MVVAPGRDVMCLKTPSDPQKGSRYPLYFWGSHSSASTGARCLPRRCFPPKYFMKNRRWVWISVYRGDIIYEI